MNETEGRNSTILNGASGLTFTLKYGRLSPRCEKCKTKFDQAALHAAVPSGRFACPQCGTPVAVRVAPAWLQELQPLATLIVGETLAVAHATSDSNSGKPIAIHCIQCGAQMQIDGKERLFNCQYCRGQIYLPDDLWLRIHPTVTTDPWFVVFDLGDSVGVVSGDGANGIETLYSIAVEPYGNMIVMYEADDKGDAGHCCRVASVNKRGLMKWVQDGIEFSDDAWIVSSPVDGNLLLVDPKKHTARWIHSQTGDPIRTIGNKLADAARAERGRDEDEGDDGRVFDPYDAKSVMVDWDGTIVVRKRYRGNSDEALKRFAPDGSAIPLWPGRLASLGDYASWEQLPARVQVPPDYTTVVTGWDGFTYIVGKQAIAKLQRDGSLLGVVTLSREIVEEIQALGVDRSGVCYALFQHAQRIGDSRYHDILRIEPTGNFTVWIGPHAAASPSQLGPSDGKMAVFPDGTLYVGDGADSLRIIAPNGQTIWRSVGTIESDENEARRLAERRKPKRVARDLDG